MKIDLSRRVLGIPGMKGFRMLRKERNVNGYYKIVGNYHKTKQRADLALRQGNRHESDK